MGIVKEKISKNLKYHKHKFGLLEHSWCPTCAQVKDHCGKRLKITVKKVKDHCEEG